MTDRAVTEDTDFPVPDWNRWQALAEGALKGGRREKTLVSRTCDGLQIEPLYPAFEGVAPYVGRAGGGAWARLQRLDHPDVQVAATQAREDLEQGADGLVLVFAGAPTARGFGLSAASADDLASLLDGAAFGHRPLRFDRSLCLDRPLRLEAGACALGAAASLLELAERQHVALADLTLDLGINPDGVLATTGRAMDRTALVRFLRHLQALGFAGRALIADGRPFAEAGASDAQELAAVIAAGVTHLRLFDEAGIAPDQGRGLLSFLLSADDDQVLTIAKFRALRRLWALVEEACSLLPHPIRLHAETGWRMMTRYDSWTNVLRTTVAAFAAGVGGADTVTVLPHSCVLGLPDSAARQLARNGQTILIEEAQVARVADPAAGSGGIEALTETLAQKAWALFQEIEREGGIARSLEQGLFPARIAETRQAREKAEAMRRAAITGTSTFPDLGEAPVAVLAPAPRTIARDGALLPSIRKAEPFECLRAAAEAAKTRPKIFLATLGTPGDFLARAIFAGSVFAAGGIVTETGDGGEDLAALAVAFKASGAPFACLCASDALYARLAGAAVEVLTQAGAGALLLASQPGEVTGLGEVAGLDGFVFAGCDALALLRDLHHRFGLAGVRERS